MSAGGPNSVAISRQSARHAVALGLVLLSVTVAGVALGGVTAAESQSGPIEVSDWTDLDDIRNDTDADYVLVNDLNETTPGYETVAGPNANAGKGFDPIGEYSFSIFDPERGFDGTFDGQGNTIANLTIDRPNEDYVGLFGDTSGDVVIQEVILTGATVTGSFSVGGLVGFNSGTVSNSSASGNVTGSDDVGGLVGDNYVGTVSLSSASGAVDGSNRVGGLVGENGGTVRNASASGAVDGSNNVGGLVGENFRGTVSNASASGAVDGSNNVGGLVGLNSGTVSESFATRAVTGSTDVGGLVGRLGSGSLDPGDEAILRDSYYDTQTTEQQAAVGTIAEGNGTAERRGEVAGLSTSQMQGASAAQNMAALDFTNTWRVVTNPPWYPELRGLPDGSGPSLTAKFTITPEDPTVGEQLTFDADPSTPESAIEGYNWTLGDGTTATGKQITHTYTDSGQFTVELTVQNSIGTDTATETVPVSPPSSPIEISDWTDLNDIRNNTDADYVLVNDLNETTPGYETVAGPNANGGKGFEPIGEYSFSIFDPERGFNGTFDGQGNTIANLTIDRPNEDYVGLFGDTSGDVVIQEVILTGATVTGSFSVGGLVGKNSGTVSNSSASGNVTGTTGSSEVGGLVGENLGGTVRNASASGAVNGSRSVGGLVGENGGTVRNASASGAVDGSNNVGGLVGGNFGGTVRNASASGAVDGSSEVGGLVGENEGTVRNASASGAVTGSKPVGGLVGFNDGTVSTSSASGAVTGSKQVGGLVGDNDDDGTVRTSAASGTVTGSRFSVGGLAGDNSGTVSTSSASGAVDGSSEVGGLVGDNYGTVSSSSASGNVTGSGSIGGLVGENGETVRNASASGNVTGSEFNVGGLVGLNDGTVRNASASGAVTGSDEVGGLVGDNRDGTVSNSSASGAVDGSDDVGGLVGRNSGTVMTSSASGAVDGSDDVGGLVGENRGGTVRNVSASGAVTGSTGSFSVGGLVGFNDGTVRNASASGAVDGSNDVGGLVGENFDGTVSNASASGNVTGSSRVGGLVGGNLGRTVRNASASGAVDGSNDVGGLVGQNVGTVRNASASGAVTGSTGSSAVGGLVGDNNDGTVRNASASGAVNGSLLVGGLVGDNKGTVRNASASGNVTGSSRVGGLIGRNFEGTVRTSSASGAVDGSDFVGGLVGRNSGTVMTSSASGNVTGSDEVGGLVGFNAGGTVSESFATGAVTGSSDVGGLVGQLGAGFLDPGKEAILRDSYYDTQTTGQQAAVGTIAEGNGTAERRGEVAGLSTSQMQGASAAQNMGALDFTSTWQVVTDPPGYPELRSTLQSAQSDFFIEKNSGFVSEPTNPTAGSATTFRTATVNKSAIKTFEWEFGDGANATGVQVSHTYDEPGTYRVVHTITTSESNEFTRSRQITVEESEEFGIANVTPHIDGVPQDDVAVLESVNFDLSYHVDVSNASTAEDVTFQIGEQTYTGGRNGDTWIFDIDPTTLNPGAQFTATASSTTGETATVSRPIEVVDLPDWLEGFTGTVLANQSTVEFEATIGVPSGSSDLSLTIPDRFNFADIDIPLAGQSQDPASSVTVSATVDLATLSTNVTIAGSAEYNLTTRLGVSGSLTGSGYLDLESGELKRATATGEIGTTIEYPPPPIGIPSPPVPPVGIPPGVVRLFPIFDIQLGADANFVASDGGGAVPLEFQSGSIEPQLTARQEIGQKYDIFELVFGLEERFAADIPIPSITPINGSIGAQAYFRASALGFQTRLAFPPGDDRFSYPFSVGGSGTAASPQATDWVYPDGSGWQLRQPTGETPPRPAAVAGDAISTADVTGSGFITNDSVTDANPALTRIDGGHLAVWSRQAPNKSVLNGRDIYLSQRTDGTFGGFEPVTNDSTRDSEPALAGPTRTEQVVVFRTLNQTVNRSNVSSPVELFPHTEIALTTATDDGNWTESQLLTNESTDDRHNVPTIGYSNETWLIAWQETVANTSGLSGQQVNYLWYNGTTSEMTTISAARNPVVAPTGNGSLQLAYLDMKQNRTTGNVTVKTFDPATQTVQATQRYGVTQFADIALANGSLAWTDESTETPVEFVATAGDNPTPVPLSLSSTPQSIDLTTSNSTTLLNARAFASNSSVAQVSYAARVDGEWLPAETYANGSAQNLTYWQGASAPARDGFVSVFAGKDLGTDQKYDIYTFDQAFRPDLSVTATTPADPANTTVGESVTLNYTVRNTGVNATATTPIALRTNGTVTLVENRSGLAPGETLTGTLNATVDETGTVTVVADPKSDTDDRNRRNNTASVRLVTPTLRVSDVTVTRENGTRTFNVTVENPLAAEVPRFNYTVEAGPTIQQQGTIASLEPGADATISLTAPIADIDPQYALRLRASPSVSDASSQSTVQFSTPLRPQLSLDSGELGYYRNESTTTAVLTVVNAGLTGTEAVVTVRNQTSGATLATERRRINASDGLSDTTFTEITVPLGTVSASQPLRFEMSRTATTERVAATAVDEVNLGTALLPPRAEIQLNRTTAVVDWPVELRATNVSSPVGEVTQFQWQVDGREITNESDVVFRPRETGTETVSLVVVNDQGLPRLVERNIQVVGLPGENPPRDVDGDGQYEDVSGADGVDLLDVQTLFESLDTPAVQQNAGAFDFSGVDAEVTVLDVQALFNELPE